MAQIGLWLSRGAGKFAEVVGRGMEIEIDPAIALPPARCYQDVGGRDSLRFQIANPGAPSANVPSVAELCVGLLSDELGSASAGPFVTPAMIALPEIVSYA